MLLNAYTIVCLQAHLTGTVLYCNISVLNKWISHREDMEIKRSDDKFLLLLQKKKKQKITYENAIFYDGLKF